jgi:ribosome-associated protein
MKKNAIHSQVAAALAACESKKASEVAVLKMDADSSTFTDYFLICSGSNPRQIQAISDEVEQQLAKAGLRPAHVEGYDLAEWVLLDYVDFVVHVFSEKARKFYDLERLWKSAQRMTASDLRAARTAKAARRKPAPSRARTAGARKTATRARKKK